MPSSVLDAFVSNITNVTYMTTLINAPGLNLRFYNPPRQFALRLSMYLLVLSDLPAAVAQVRSALEGSR